MHTCRMCTWSLTDLSHDLEWYFHKEVSFSLPSCSVQWHFYFGITIIAFVNILLHLALYHAFQWDSETQDIVFLWFLFLKYMMTTVFVGVPSQRKLCTVTKKIVYSYKRTDELETIEKEQRNDQDWNPCEKKLELSMYFSKKKNCRRRMPSPLSKKIRKCRVSLIT